MDSPQEFKTSLKRLLAAAYHGGVTFDRSWAVRRKDDEPDLMVEVTYLSDDRDMVTPCRKRESAMSVETFEMELSSFLADAARSNVSFDRAWTFRCTDCPDLMVEITRLAKPE